MSCNSKHTKFQPTEDQWKCPVCGTDNKNGDFYVDENYGDENCELLHVDDYIKCEICGSTFDGKDLAKAIQKKFDLVPCSCCKGTGFVKRTV